MAKIPQTRKQLEEYLDEQVSFLESSAMAYDQGEEAEAKRLASTIRLLVHDTNHSTSLLKQLDMKEIGFYNTAGEVLIGNALTHNGIVSMYLKAGEHARFVAPLDNKADTCNDRTVAFDNWWEQIVFVDEEKRAFTRKDIILYLANMDGGSHVDPCVDEDYAKLSREGSLGWKSEVNGEERILDGPELPAARQIAHELLKSIRNISPPNYNERKIPPMLANALRQQAAKPIKSGKKVGRNEPCPCGSGKKFKKCHGSPK